MSECESCGRDDGHYLGCAEAAKSQAEDLDVRNARHASGRPEEGVTSEDTAPPKGAEMCAYGDCVFQRRPKGKGPAPKYCEEHSDPKNRK